MSRRHGDERRRADPRGVANHRDPGAADLGAGGEGDQAHEHRCVVAVARVPGRATPGDAELTHLLEKVAGGDVVVPVELQVSGCLLYISDAAVERVPGRATPGDAELTHLLEKVAGGDVVVPVELQVS